MVDVVSKRHLALRLLLLLFVIIVFVQNLYHKDLSEKNRSLSQKGYVFGPYDCDPVTETGFRFFNNENLSVDIANLEKYKRFRIEMRFVVYTIKFIHFRLDGNPSAVDISLAREDLPDFSPGKSYEIVLEGYPDRLELLLDGKYLREVRFEDHNFNRFVIEAFGTSMSVEYQRFLTQTAVPIKQMDFKQKIFGFDFKIACIAVLFFVALGLCFIDYKRSVGSTLEESVGKVIFFLTPLWVCTLFPTTAKGTLEINILFLVSILPLAASMFFNPTPRARSLAGLVTAFCCIIALSWMALIWFQPVSAVILLSMGILSLVFCTTESVVSFRGKAARGLSRLAPALFSASAGLLIAFVGLDKGHAMIPALIFSSFVMLLFLIHKRRKEISGFMPLALFLLVVVLGTAEMSLRASAIETRFRPMNLGKTFVTHDDLLFVPGDLFSNTVDLKIGTLCFRDREALLKKSEDTFRIINMGGSNCWGDGITHSNKTFSGLMDKCLNESDGPVRFEVLNAGVKGFSLFQLMILLEHYALSYKPDMLILYINVNDSTTRHGPFTYRELWKMKNEGRWSDVESQYSNSISPIPGGHWIISLQGVLRNIRLYNMLVQRITSARENTLEDFAKSFDVVKDVNPPEDYLENLRHVIEICAKNDIRLVLVDAFYIGWNPKDDIIRGMMKQEAERNGLGYIGIDDEFGKREDMESLVFSHDTIHLNYKGHRLVAERLCSYLKESGALPVE